MPIFLDLRSGLEENHFDISSLHQGYFLASCHQLPGSTFLSVLAVYPHFLVFGYLVFYPQFLEFGFLVFYLLFLVSGCFFFSILVSC